MKPLHTMLLLACCALCGYATWSDGFPPGAADPPLLLLSGLLAVILSLAVRTQAGLRLLRDPLLHLGLLFFLLIGIQSWNAGRWLYFNPVDLEWTYTAPPYPVLPWSFSRAESLQMFHWFVPPWVLALTLRHAPRADRLARGLLLFMMINGVLLAAFAVLQHVVGNEHLLWRRTVLQQQFYGAFGYRNHACAYFVLVLALLLGRLHYQLRKHWAAGETGFAPGTWVLGGGAAVVFVAIHPALGRTGIAFAWLLVLLFLGSLSTHKTHVRSPAEQWQRVAIFTLVSGIVCSWILLFGGDALARRMDGSFVDTLRANIQSRSWMWTAAWLMWEDHKLWGVGGWGYRYLLPLYADGAGLSEVHLPGKANAHNDALQFLAEFGIFGFGLLVSAVGVLCARYARAWRRAWDQPVFAFFTMTAAALFLVGLHSLFDLPFRNPAVLLTCALLLAGVPATRACHPDRTR